MLYIASLPGGSGCCPGAVGSATRATHSLTPLGQWTVQLLRCIATPSGGGGQWNSCNVLAHQLGGRGVVPRRRLLPKERYSPNALTHYVGALGRGTPVMPCHTASRAVESDTPAMRTNWRHGESYPRGGHCLRSGTSAMHRNTAWEQWASELQQCTASIPGGSAHCMPPCTPTLPRGRGQWNLCNALDDKKDVPKIPS